MGENTLALLEYLSSSESPLPSLTAGYTKPATVYFQSFGHFFVYSYEIAGVMYALLFGISASFSLLSYPEHASGFIPDVLRGLTAIGSAAVGAIIGANAVAFIMAEVLKKPLSWFSIEYSCTALYGPAALTGNCPSL